ncbi:ankyrin repeat domain-containing protein [Nannocystis punicea]|uniref:Ankyrin repeat domain-containing protein n=1 Tax=Nannocystis punicea TaxID=2995304 RepID=A0ABY7H7R1_9BACT|nr:ankyrin repeat domain-containing protein [Nannocystis poenicansa]WAS95125.1 ankyrin repeat domain-containing protein [Nannocystis poenicansa]
MAPDEIEPMVDAPLLEAVRAGSLDDVRRRLAATTSDLDTRNHAYGYTALELAIALGRVDVARLLLDAGADPNAPSANDTDALTVAIEEFGEEAHPSIELLLAGGARPTDAALLAAAQAGDLWAVDRLLAALPSESASVRDLDAIEGALLAAAVRRGDPALFERVRARSDEVSAHYLQWAFEAAADSGQSGMWGRLLQLGEPDLPRALRSAALAFLRNGTPAQYDMLRRITRAAGQAAAGQLFAFAVTCGLDVSDRTEALLALARECHGDLDARNAEGMTALLMAADRHHIQHMRRLIALGADRHARDATGRGLSAYVERWPQSVRLAEARAYLTELGVPSEPPATSQHAAPRDPTGAAALLGLAIAVAIVAGVLLLHALGLL